MLTCSSWALAQPLDEASGTERICRSSPAAEVARATRLRGDAAVTAARVLPNPELSVEHDRILTGDDSHETTIGLGVPLGLGGRRSILGDAARARRSAAHADAEASLFEQALAFRETFARAAVEQARVRVLEEHQRELEDLAAVIRGLARAGEVAGFDLARQQAQVRLHRRTLDSARARAASTRRLLDAWLGAPIRVPVAAPATIAGGPELRARARSGLGDHPRVRSLEADARGARLEAKAARRRAVPDLGVFVGYRTVTAPAGGGTETGHGFRAALSVPLPLFDHGQGEAARAEAEGSAARATAAQLRREQKARAGSELARLDALERGSPEMERAVNESESLRAKARMLYAAGELSLTELLDTYRAVEETRLGRLDLVVELAEARLGLMRALGTQLDARLDRACGRQP